MLEHLRRAVQLSPDSPQAQSNLGSALMNLGRYCTKRWDISRRRFAFAPSLPGLAATWDTSFTHWGVLDESEKCYRDAIRLQPDLVAAFAGLGRVLEELGDIRPGGRRVP